MLLRRPGDCMGWINVAQSRRVNNIILDDYQDALRKMR